MKNYYICKDNRLFLSGFCAIDGLLWRSLDEIDDLSEFHVYGSREDAETIIELFDIDGARAVKVEKVRK